MFFMVKDAGLTPDLLSYAAALQCMGRLDQDTDTIRRWVGVRGPGDSHSRWALRPRWGPPCVPHRCLKQMAQDGLQLEGLFTSVLLSEEERAELLKAVRKAKPTFSVPCPRPPPPQVNTSPLLREIYAKVSPCLWPDISGVSLKASPGASVPPPSLLVGTPPLLLGHETSGALTLKVEAGSCQQGQAAMRCPGFPREAQQ